MYRNKYQNGKFFTVFSSLGSKPLSNWMCRIHDGHCKRIVDEELNSFALELVSNCVSSSFIRTPIAPYKSIAVKLPFITLLTKNIGKYFAFEIQIRDNQNFLRRFQAANFQVRTNHGMFQTRMPLLLEDGWNKIELNLADFTYRAYGTHYLETVAIRINANTRLRRIYFSDQLYAEDEKPMEFRLNTANRIYNDSKSNTITSNTNNNAITSNTNSDTIASNNNSNTTTSNNE